MIQALALLQHVPTVISVARAAFRLINGEGKPGDTTAAVEFVGDIAENVFPAQADYINAVEPYVENIINVLLKNGKVEEAEALRAARGKYGEALAGLVEKAETNKEAILSLTDEEVTEYMEQQALFREEETDTEQDDYSFGLGGIRNMIGW